MLNLAMKRRSIRKYKDKPIEKDKIDLLIQAALTSPTGRNLQPYNLMVIDDKEVIENLSHTRDIMTKVISKAPLVMVVINDPTQSDTWIPDSSIMSFMIQLLATDLGLGSCWIQARNRYCKDDTSVEENIKEVLSLPNNYRVECLLTIGYPDEDKKPYDKDELNYDLVHYNKYKDRL